MGVIRTLPCLLVCLIAVVAVAAPEGPPPRAELPESSRWLSFVRLVEARWDVRTRVPPADEDARRALFDRCTSDAWHLSRPGLLARGAPCRRLLGEPAAPAKVRPRPAPAPAEVLDAAGYRRCVARAAAENRSALLDRCVPSLDHRLEALRVIEDEVRFQRWFGACKKAILHDAEPSDPLQEEHARHCLRTLPAFYEVRWMKKLSEYWTADEQKRLYQRTQQLGD